MNLSPISTDTPLPKDGKITATFHPKGTTIESITHLIATGYGLSSHDLINVKVIPHPKSDSLCLFTAEITSK